MKRVTKNRSQAKGKVETLEQWAAQYCEERGFSWEYAEQNGAVLVTEAEARKRGYKPALPGILFQSFNPATNELHFGSRIRYQQPPTIDGRLRKFNARARSEAAPFFASSLDWQRVLKDAKLGLVITEGETRSIAGAKHNIPVIALPGIDAGFVAGTKRGELHPTLRAIKMKGREVYIVPDADATGNANVRAATEQLAVLFSALGATVKVIALPRIKEHAGLDDLLAMHSGADLFKALCASAPVWSGGRAESEPVMLRGDEIEDVAIEWLWRHRVPSGMLTGLEGNPGEGKSWIALNIAAEGSRGREPFTRKAREKFSTVYLSVENLPATLMRRYRAMGGDLKRFHLLKGARSSDGSTRSITLADIAVIEKAVVKTGARLVVVDPLQSYIGASVDLHRSNETRPVLDALAMLAERHNLAVIVVRHLAKGTTSRSIHKGLGSIDIAAAMRSILMVGSSAEDARNHALVHVKHSESPPTEPLKFDYAGSDDKTKLVWCGISELNATDLSAPEKVKPKTKVDRAAEWILEQLRSADKVFVGELVTDEFDERTIQRAAQKIGVKRGREGEGGAWFYMLPKFAPRAQSERRSQKKAKHA